MSHTEQHPLIDLTAELPEGASTKLRERRAFFRQAGLAAFAAGATADAFAQNFDRYSHGAPPVRYPEPDVIALDKRFKYKLGNTPILRLYSGTMWAEGPAWNGVGRYLVWSDIPNDEILRWCEEDGHVGRRFRFPSGNSNGNTFDFQGRQISFCHGTRRVIRYENDGSVTVLADKADGKELNAPNDGAVHPDGWLLFTDPGYGSLMNYEGNRLPASAGSVQPIQKEAVYRVDAPGRGHQGRGRARQAQRAMLLAGLSQVLHRRHRHHALPGCQERGLGLRRRWQEPAQRPGLRVDGIPGQDGLRRRDPLR